MSKPVPATDYLAKPDSYPVRPVCVAAGDDPFLKRQVLETIRQEVLAEEDAEFSLTVFEGPKATAAEVFEELTTVAMFGGDRRLVVVDEADEFVSANRPALEDYVAGPSRSGVLLLQVKSWPANTRLAKAVAAEGLTVQCTAPTAGRLATWLRKWAKQAHRVALEPAAAEMLVELVGPELGLLDQELAKLAVSTGPDATISPETVQQMVGSWRAKTAWDMLDAAMAGDVRQAMSQLDRLLLAGESPIAVLGQIAASLRRFAAATRLILQTEASGRRPALKPALEEAGVKQFVLEKAQHQLRQLGRHRGAVLYRWLLETDLALKGDSALPPRLVLENLLIRLASPEAKQPVG
ncbi:MAG: DNA polymerase III subunit delta [Pirellulales bacterium]|nr:DNA polymerase III subunit delta [Pirellulales bacterium]